MREIRRVNPAAELVQTEDLGKTYSTPALGYQAEFNNELRWLVWDLLSGRVSHEHRLWQWLTEVCGATPSELSWFADNPCPPALIGVNHYVTSERYLDERLELYPQRYHGGNCRHAYADIEASRSLALPTGGLRSLLTEAWERHGVPLVVSEIHIDATRNDHLRWIKESWDATQAARRAGVAVRGFTAWALLGSFDWNCLLTANHGYYEPGAFDVRAPYPRETAVADLLRELSAGSAPTHPVLSGPGWWHREDRFFCPPATAAQAPSAQSKVAAFKSQPILISGATGTLGRAFAIICARRGLEYRLLGRSELDIANEDSVRTAIGEHTPWAVINASGYVRIDEAEHDVDRCHRENVTGPALLAATCARLGLPLIMFSSDMVFDGRHDSPYVETDDPSPLNVYGRSKADAEARVLARHPDALVIRTSSFFGPWDESNYVVRALRSLQAGRIFHAPRDLTVSPTYVPDLVDASLDLLIDGEKGIWHLTNEKAITWADFAAQAAERANLGHALLRPCANDELLLQARRPAYSALRSERSSLMPGLENALDRFFTQRELTM
jgi:dTDP-4-dehydrorhamnose reductase